MNGGLQGAVLGSLLAALVGAVSAQTVDVSKLERELEVLFERAPGAAISEQQKEGLAALLQRYEGSDLGKLDYVRALPFYFRRDAIGGAARLDEFFAHHDQIENAEHRMIAGRIYLVAMREESTRQTVDKEKLQRWAERAAAMFPDLLMVARQANLLAIAPADGPGFRLALVRGMQKATADEALKDQFLTILYTPLVPGTPVQGSGRDVVAVANAGPGDVVKPAPIGGPGGTPEAGPESGRNAPAAAVSPAVAVESAKPAAPGLRIGGEVPELPVEHVANQKPEFRLSDLRGNVVVLDFFASWCPPCRSGIGSVIELAKQEAGGVKLVGVTRFYGKGMDFVGEATVPHGGKSVQGLTRAEEIELNGRFAKVFAMDYPLLFTTEKAMKETFGVTAIPTTFVIGKDGRVVGRVMGNGKAELVRLKELIAEAGR